MKVLNSLNFLLKIEHMESNDSPSVTVPNQALSVREIMQRFTRGQVVPRLNNMVYTGDDYLPDVRALDLTDVDDLKRDIDSRLSDGKANIEAMKLKFTEAEAARNKPTLPTDGDGEA